MFEELLFIFLGILAGTVTGLIPGLHVNTVCALLLGFTLSGKLSSSPLSLSIFIFALSITHTFLDFIPSILLGVPSEDTVLALLPGHRLVLEGCGPEAIKLTLIGSIGCLILSLLLFPLFLTGIPTLYNSIEPYMGILLLACSAFLIWIEKGKQKLWSLLVFSLSGALGIITLRSSLFRNPLLPLLTGLFGLSLLLMAIKNKVEIPDQESGEVLFSRKMVVRGLLSGTVAGAVVGFLPGFGPSQAAVMSRTLMNQRSSREFLITLGGINTANSFFALVALLTIGKRRSGAVAAISELMTVDLDAVLILLSAGLLAGTISLIMGAKLADVFPRYLHRFNYQKLNFGIIAFILLMTIYMSGSLGLVVLAVATSIGLVAHNSKTHKMHLMGVLIVPTALWFLGVG